MRSFNRVIGIVCRFTLASLILAGWTSTACADEGETSAEWEKYFGVWLWAPNIYIKSATGGHTTLTIKDIINNLDMIAFMDFGAQKDKWSIGSDFIYMNLGKRIAREGEILPVGANVRLDMRAFVNTTKVGYQVAGDHSNPFRVTGGVRYLYIRTSAEFDTDNIGDRDVLGSGHNWSGVVGLEGRKTLNKKWYLDYYADIGAGGKTDLTWQANIGGGYHFNKFTGTFGFRYMRWNFDSSKSSLENLRVIGPHLGAMWTF